MNEQFKEKVREEFRKLQEITLDYGQLGEVKSYLLNEQQHNHICNWWLTKLDEADRLREEEIIQLIKRRERPEYTKPRNSSQDDINYGYNSALEEVVDVIKGRNNKTQ